MEHGLYGLRFPHEYKFMSDKNIHFDWEGLITRRITGSFGSDDELWGRKLTSSLHSTTGQNIHYVYRKEVHINKKIVEDIKGLDLIVLK